MYSSVWLFVCFVYSGLVQCSGTAVCQCCVGRVCSSGFKLFALEVTRVNFDPTMDYHEEFPVSSRLLGEICRHTAKIFNTIIKYKVYLTCGFLNGFICQVFMLLKTEMIHIVRNINRL
jgi:hypothetical protein